MAFLRSRDAHLVAFLGNVDLGAGMSLLFLALSPSQGPPPITQALPEGARHPPRLGREGKLELTEEARLEQPCLREFQKGALGDVNRRQVRRFRPAEPVRIAP